MPGSSRCIVHISNYASHERGWHILSVSFFLKGEGSNEHIRSVVDNLRRFEDYFIMMLMHFDTFCYSFDHSAWGVSLVCAILFHMLPIFHLLTRRQQGV